MRRCLVLLGALALLSAREAESPQRLVQGTSGSKSDSLELHSGGLLLREGSVGAAFGTLVVGDGKRQLTYFVVLKHRFGGSGKTGFSDDCQTDDEKGESKQEIQIDGKTLKIGYKVALTRKKLSKETLTIDGKALDPAKGRVILVDLTAKQAKWEQVKVKLPEDVSDTSNKKEAEAVALRVLESITEQDKKVKDFVAAAGPLPDGKLKEGRDKSTKKDEADAERKSDRPKSISPAKNASGYNRANGEMIPLAGQPGASKGMKGGGGGFLGGVSQANKDSGMPKPGEKPKGPQVWKRDQSRPTFARVYTGGGNSLELVSLQVSVVVEGARARTYVDHIFRNPHDRRLEGTFEYPLPSGASPSYYAMFISENRDMPPPRFRPRQPNQPMLVLEQLQPAQIAREVSPTDWGKLQEARVVAPQRAREVYEDIVRGQIDPALLEYASGNTFSGRVFPIPPKGHNRVLIAYEETLPVTQGQLAYRFPLPTCQVKELQFSLQANASECKEAVFYPKDAKKEAGDARVTFSHTWKDTKPSGEVRFAAKPADATIQASSGKHGEKGPVYVHARLRPTLPAAEKQAAFAKHAVFLLDCSQSEYADRIDVSMKLLRNILEADEDIEHFNILTFNVGSTWLDRKGWIPNTKEGRDKALGKLDGLVLEGATDVSGALDALAAGDFGIEKLLPISCFVLSDGHMTWGRTDPTAVVARFRKRSGNPTRFYCYRTGLGQENADLFDALTREGGSTFQCFGEAEVKAAAVAHRRQCLEVQKVAFDVGTEAKEVLVAGRRSAVYPEGELVVVGQAGKTGKTKITVEGMYQGAPFSQTFPLEVRAEGELAPRAWGETAVASLLSLEDPWVETLVTAYCQEFNIASRAASFLVLENEAEYQRFDIKKEKDRALEADLDVYLDRVISQLATERSLKQPLQRLLSVIDSRTKVLSGKDSEHLRKLLGLVSDEDCTLPDAPISGALLFSKDADKAYLDGRAKDRRSAETYLTEAERRYRLQDVDGAVRALSNVIEEHPARGDALRLVGYRLLDLKQPAHATGLFSRVLRQRPFEPHSYRDMARSLEEGGRYPLAAVMNETVLAGTWHARFGSSMKLVTQEEYARLLRTGLKFGKLSEEQRTFFDARLKQIAAAEPKADLRVSITWNTDGTDVDLHIAEPDGKEVFYGRRNGMNGSELSEDLTNGYGPERYIVRQASRGEYKVLVNYFSGPRNQLSGETHVSVTVTRYAGSDQEDVKRYTVVLKRQSQKVLVTSVKF